jgi:hypothetical protein
MVENGAHSCSSNLEEKQVLLGKGAPCGKEQQTKTALAQRPGLELQLCS